MRLPYPYAFMLLQLVAFYLTSSFGQDVPTNKLQQKKAPANAQRNQPARKLIPLRDSDSTGPSFSTYMISAGTQFTITQILFCTKSSSGYILYYKYCKANDDTGKNNLVSAGEMIEINKKENVLVLKDHRYNLSYHFDESKPVELRVLTGLNSGMTVFADGDKVIPFVPAYYKNEKSSIASDSASLYDASVNGSNPKETSKVRRGTKVIVLEDFGKYVKIRFTTSKMVVREGFVLRSVLVPIGGQN